MRRSACLTCAPARTAMTVPASRASAQCQRCWTGLPAVVALMFLCLTPGAYSQSSLDLDLCIALALRNSPRLRMADNSVRTASLSMSELNTTALPQVQAILDATQTPIPPRFGYDPVISNGGEVSGRLVLRQSIYDAGVRGLRSDQISADLERLSSEHRLAGLDLVLAVKQAFTEALRAREEAGLDRESVDQLDAYLGLVRRLHNAGSAGTTDVLKTELQISSARLALTKAMESSAAATLELEELAGIPPDTSLALIGSLADTAGTNAGTLGGPADIASTLDMTVAGMLVQRSVLDHEILSRERLPVISFVADAGYISSGENLRLAPADRLNALGYSVGIGIELPILNWGATGFRIEQQDLATDDLRNRMELLRRSLASDTRKLHIQLDGTRERLRLARENLVKADDNFILTKSKYAAGDALSLEVLAAQQVRTDARLSEVQALADLRTLAARIERLNAR